MTSSLHPLFAEEALVDLLLAVFAVLRDGQDVLQQRLQHKTQVISTHRSTTHRARQIISYRVKSAEWREGGRLYHPRQLLASYLLQQRLSLIHQQGYSKNKNQW